MTPEEIAKIISQRYSLWGDLGRDQLEYEISNSIGAAIDRERRECADLADEHRKNCLSCGCDGEQIAQKIRARGDQ